MVVACTHIHSSRFVLARTAVCISPKRQCEVQNHVCTIHNIPE